MTKASDNDFPSLLLTEQGSAPTTPAASHQRLYIRTSDHTLVTVNSSGTVTPVASGGADPTYTGYTPALTGSTSNPTLGSGSSAAGRYSQHGKLVHFYGKIAFGSSGVAAGSGQYLISLPVTSRSPSVDVFGAGVIFDSSAGLFYNVSIYTNGDTANFRMIYANSTSPVSNTAPWTWAASDIIFFQGMYEAA